MILFWSEHKVEAFRSISDKVCILLSDGHTTELTLELPIISKRKLISCKQTFAKAQTYQEMCRKY